MVISEPCLMEVRATNNDKVHDVKLHQGAIDCFLPQPARLPCTAQSSPQQSDTFGDQTELPPSTGNEPNCTTKTTLRTSPCLSPATRWKVQPPVLRQKTPQRLTPADSFLLRSGVGSNPQRHPAQKLSVPTDEIPSVREGKQEWQGKSADTIVVKVLKHSPRRTTEVAAQRQGFEQTRDCLQWSLNASNEDYREFYSLNEAYQACMIRRLQQHRKRQLTSKIPEGQYPEVEYKVIDKVSKAKFRN